jgi:Protein of unknown function (DUF3800)
MYLMYVDESGDPGKFNGLNSKHFILSGIIISQNDWMPTLKKLKDFKDYCKKQYNLPIGTEIHASELIRINKLEDYKSIKKHDRINIIKDFMREIPLIFSTSKIINVYLDKEQFPESTDFQQLAWQRLIQRFDTYLKRSAKDLGMIISDDTNEPLVRALLRKMRVYNPVPNMYPSTSGQSFRQIPTDNIIEDVIMKASDKSYFIQAVDTVAHCLYRREQPKGSLKKYNIEVFFNFLEPILLKEAAKTDKDGIVRR